MPLRPRLTAKWDELEIEKLRSNCAKVPASDSLVRLLASYDHLDGQMNLILEILVDARDENRDYRNFVSLVQAALLRH